MDRTNLATLRAGRATKSRRHTPLSAAVGAALLACALFCGGRTWVQPGSQNNQAAATATEAASEQKQHEVQRRLALGAAGFLGAPLPASANILDGMTTYTFFDAFQVDMPSEYELLKDTPGFKAFQGTGLGVLNQYAVSAKVSNYKSLSEALNGTDIKKIAVSLAADRPYGGDRESLQGNPGSDILKADAKPFPEMTGAEAWEFQFINEVLRETVLFALVPKGNEKVLMSMTLRAPPRLWFRDGRNKLFEKIIKSFKPLTA
eukprot:TRINITY_DN90603_c0_g1_i1.p1 TRINITY_DN90603_c0_g1~~TRINITY_DN90603_c0_g1_i1.p1  ORF type:complete len:261 (-),score=75.46 TRINITY_DN90603_c0_g1_i1:150-932(-)